MLHIFLNVKDFVLEIIICLYILVVYFNGIDLNKSSMLFEYNLLCDKPYSLMCFHDDNYNCLCDMYNRAECFRYDSRLDQCNERCLVGGQCIQGDLTDRKDFICLCPRCYYGSICQHNTQLFSFTLETLLTKDLYSPLIFVQRIFFRLNHLSILRIFLFERFHFSLLIIIPTILFVIGLMNNICCYVTFNRSKPLLVGNGHYLRTASIINQITLLLLLFKLIHLVLSVKGFIVHQMINRILCKVLSYLVVCSTRISYWLMGFVAVERVYVTCYVKAIWLKSPRIAKRIIGIIVIVMIICDIHQLIYYESIEDPKSLDMTNSTWCVTSYPFLIGIYNQIIIIFNYVLPFLINILSTLILIIRIVRRRNLAKKKDHRRSIFGGYVNLFKEYKELILAPSVSMVPQLFFLPQFILSFSFACRDFNIRWQRYLLIITFFITYLPQVFSYKLYVSPSSFYTREFHSTNLYKKISRWKSFLNL